MATRRERLNRRRDLQLKTRQKNSGRKTKERARKAAFAAKLAAEDAASE